MLVCPTVTSGMAVRLNPQNAQILHNAITHHFLCESPLVLRKPSHQMEALHNEKRQFLFCWS